MAILQITYNNNIISTESVSGTANVVYGGQTIATISTGDTKTLKTAGKFASGDITVGSKIVKCNGKMLEHDIVLQMFDIPDPDPEPSVTVISFSRSKMSTVSGYNSCDITFSVDIDLDQFEIRATRVGNPRGHGVGDLLFQTTNVTAGQSILATISSASITQGDGDYVISLWGKAGDGIFDFGCLYFDAVNFGKVGKWNQ